MITELRFTVVTPPALPGSNQFPVHTGNRNVSSDSDTKQTHKQKNKRHTNKKPVDFTEGEEKGRGRRKKAWGAAWTLRCVTGTVVLKEPGVQGSHMSLLSEGRELPPFL